MQAVYVPLTRYGLAFMQKIFLACFRPPLHVRVNFYGVKPPCICMVDTYRDSYTGLWMFTGILLRELYQDKCPLKRGLADILTL
jgi:hypothetical protein